MIDTRQLTDLLALIEHRYFREAARVLGVSQPTLTKSIQRLESDLRVQLLKRGHHGVRPTPIGQRVIDGARQAVAGVEQASDDRVMSFRRLVCHERREFVRCRRESDQIERDASQS